MTESSSPRLLLTTTVQLAGLAQVIDDEVTIVVAVELVATTVLPSVTILALYTLVVVACDTPDRPKQRVTPPVRTRVSVCAVARLYRQQGQLEACLRSCVASRQKKM